MTDPEVSEEEHLPENEPGIVLRMLQQTWVRIALLSVALACVMAIPGLTYITRNQMSEGQIAAQQLPISLQNLERSLGYSGLIHNFKNAVLRPSEPRYYDDAVRNYETAVETLDEIAAQGQAIGRTLSFPDLRATLRNYRENLDLAREAAQEGYSIHQVDEIVRIPDEEATLDLQVIHDEVRDALQSWLSADARRAELQLAALSALLFLTAAGGVVFLVVTYLAERERIRQAEELNNRLASLGQLTSGIAHDVNNMLATIYYAVDLTLGDQIPETSRTFLNSASRALDRGRELTARLLSFARPQPGTPQALLVSEVFDNVKSLAEPQLGTQIALTLHQAKPGLTIYCDQSQLENALLNLILNSRDAILQSGTGGEIRLNARVPNRADIRVSSRDTMTHAHHSGHPGRLSMEKHVSHFALLSVEDDGPGMPEEVRRRAMEPFFTTKAAHSGSGLGMAIVYGFANASGGEMQILSEMGEGCAVRLILPRGEARQGPAPVAPAPAAIPSKKTALGHARILLAEDEDELRKMIATALKASGYDVCAFADGPSAMDFVYRGEDFDLLLTDVVMHDSMNGYELARQVRALYPAMPVLYLTAHAGPQLSQDVEVQAPVLRKPCPTDLLAEAIARALNAAPAALKSNTL